MSTITVQHLATGSYAYIASPTRTASIRLDLTLSTEQSLLASADRMRAEAATLVRRAEFIEAALATKEAA